MNVKLNNFFIFAIVFVVVFVTRLPFVGNGFGADIDAHRLVLASKYIGETGTYIYSRLPGYPFVEFFYSLFKYKNPLLFNTLVALISSIAVGFFSLTLKKLNIKNYLIGALTLSFIPAIYINSTNSMDYLWGFSFFIISLFFILNKNILFAGIFLGLAISSRITYAPMIIPFLIVVLRNDNNKLDIKNILHLAIPSIFISILFFMPVFLKYGISFLTYSSRKTSPFLFIFNITYGVWGIIGTIALFIAMLFLIIKIMKKENILNIEIKKTYLISFLSIILIYLALFFKLPLDGAYLIPIIPIIIIFLSLILEKKILYVICVLLILSSFFMGLFLYNDTILNPKTSNSTIKLRIKNKPYIFDFLNGPIFINQISSKTLEQYIKKVIIKFDSITENTVIICGIFEPVLKQKMNILHGNNIKNNVFIEYLLTEDKLKFYRDNKYKIYYLTGQNNFNKDIYKIDLDKLDAKLF